MSEIMLKAYKYRIYPNLEQVALAILTKKPSTSVSGGSSQVYKLNKV